jgi:hypothetical protein
MSDEDRYELGEPEAHAPLDPEALPELAEPAPPRGLDPWLLGSIVLAGVLAVGLLVTFALRRSGSPQPEPSPSPTRSAAPSASPAATAPPTPEPPLELPALDASDALVRELLAALSSRPELAAWLAHEAIVRTFVVCVDNVAEGRSPARHVRFLAPKEPFATTGPRGALRIATASFARYDLAADVLQSIEPAAAARLYHQLAPLAQQAYRELGYPDGDFRPTLDRAIAELLGAPVLPDDVALVPAVLSYRFADPGLEARSDAQKQLLRLGPRNQKIVQGWLRRFAEALDAQAPSSQPAAEVAPTP